MSIINLKESNKPSSRNQVDPPKEETGQIEKSDGKEAFHEEAIKEFSDKSARVLLSWHAPEFEKHEKSQQWYIFLALIILIIVSYAIWTNSPVMAITFILIGIVGYLYSKNDPQKLEFKITEECIYAGNKIFEYENIKSFWIFYEPEGLKSVSLHTASMLMPLVHIPIGQANPIHIRECLLRFLPEVKQKKTILDEMGKILGI